MPTPAAAAALAEAVSAVPAGQVELNGKRYMPKADGSVVPLELVKPAALAQDQAVRDLLARAETLELELAAFKAQAFDDVDALLTLLQEKYQAKPRGEKGNQTLYTHDGLMKLVVQVSDLIKFGPELQIAKDLLDECVGEWVEGSRAELRALVMNAFRRDKEGQINRGAILGLRSYEISDERWVRAMRAIADSIQVIGSKRYIRFSRRATLDGAWEEVSLNIATAKAPPNDPLSGR